MAVNVAGRVGAIADAAQCAMEIVSSIQERISQLKRLNVIVAGKTGSGKSTLINSVFREKLAETGIGKPVTQHMRRYAKEGMPLAIYDTMGFELSRENQAASQQEIADTIRKGVESGDINEQIHCIWYCINSAGSRVEQAEIDWLREICRMTHVPVIIVLTQSYNDDNVRGIMKALKDENLNVVQIIPVMAQDYVLKFGSETHVRKAFGLDVLVKVMETVLPEALQDTLQNVQIASLELKKERAHKIVAAAASAAAVTGASPIPFSDCALLVPEQLSMLAGITVIFDIKVDRNILAVTLSATVGAGGAALLGRTAVSTLLKFIPGAGTVIGGAISASTAAIITGALGEAYIKIMEQIWLGDMELDELASEVGRKKMVALFKSELSLENHNED